MKSLPSREVHSVNVPEPKNVASDFRYNFFVPTEGSQELDATSRLFLKNVPQSYPIDGSLELYAEKRVARFVKLTWTIPAAKTADVPPGFISTNAKKIVSETSFSTNNFMSVLFSDPVLNGRVHGFVSGSVELQQKGADLYGRKLSTMYGGAVSQTSDFNIVTAGLDQIRERFGMSFFDVQGVELEDAKWDGLNNVSMVVQLSSVLSHGIVEKVIADPHAPYTEELKPLLSSAKKLTNYAMQARMKGLSDDDFRTYAPYVDVRPGNVSLAAGSAEVVGYVIDKVEFNPDGSVTQHPSVYVENHAARSYVDVRVRYGSTYGYTVRSVSRVRTAAIDDKSYDVALITFLVGSRPSNRTVSRCIEMVPPPVPNDIRFLWNYEENRLYVHWSLPTNPRRDIKEFQVFRRSSVAEPFQLQRVFRFNDADAQNDQTIHVREENIFERAVTYSSSPVLFWVDEEFTMDSSYIYTIASVDAHGLVSNYGVQHRIGFDRFKNKLTLEQVSHSGAPRSYPNMYLAADLFVDTIKVAGPASKRGKLYFNPEFYTMVDNFGQEDRVVVTKQDGGSYVFQWINTDNQKMTKFEVALDDRRSKK